MKLTEDQIGALNHIVYKVGYNGGFEIKRPLFKRSGPIQVKYFDQNRRPVECLISSVGARSERNG